MIGYVLFGTNDLEKSLTFYDQLLEPLNLKRGPNTERVHLYTDGNGPMFGVCMPADGGDVFGTFHSRNCTPVATVPISMRNKGFVQNVSDPSQLKRSTFTSPTFPSDDQSTRWTLPLVHSLSPEISNKLLSVNLGCGFMTANSEDHSMTLAELLGPAPLPTTLIR